MNKSLGQCIKESLQAGNFKRKGIQSSNDLQTNSSRSTESSLEGQVDMDEHFKYIKILLDYNIIDFTCKFII